MATIRRMLLPTMALAALLGTWEAIFRLSGFNLDLFPPPSRVIVTIFDLLTPTDARSVPALLVHLSVSVARLAASMTIALVAGVGIGLLMGMNRYFYRAFYPWVNALMPIPPYAYIPLMLLWAGRGNVSIIIVTSLSACLPLIYGTIAGVRSVERSQVRALQSFGAGKLDGMRLALFPAALTSIVAGMRVSFGQAWRTLVGAEFIAAPAAGLGYMIFNARNLLQVDVMFAGLFALGVFGFWFIYVFIGWIEARTVVRWGMLAKR
jgi:NitT/TauT family transport system permease protein